MQILKNRGPAILEKRIAACTDEREVAKMREHIAKINAHGTPPAASAAQGVSCGVASGTRRAALQSAADGVRAVRVITEQLCFPRTAGGHFDGG